MKPTNLLLDLEDSGDLRHYVAGREVHCGDFLEMQLGGERGPWVMVRYEANFDRAKKQIQVCLYAVGARLYPDADAIFRWPEH